jgi:Flp pilus assembly protein TadB
MNKTLLLLLILFGLLLPSANSNVVYLQNNKEVTSLVPVGKGSKLKKKRIKKDRLKRQKFRKKYSFKKLRQPENDSKKMIVAGIALIAAGWLLTTLFAALAIVFIILGGWTNLAWALVFFLLAFHFILMAIAGHVLLRKGIRLGYYNKYKKW